MLKFTNPPSHHADGFGEITPGRLGAPFIVMVLGVLVPGVQAVVFATTVTWPLANGEGGTVN